MVVGRSLVRQSIVQALYQWDMTGQPAADIVRRFIHNDSLKGKYYEQFQQSLTLIPEVVDELDSLIGEHIKRDIKRVDPLERAILRLATYELRYDHAVPTKVVIDEAIDLAKVFCADQGYKFVNGVIDKVAKSLRKDIADADGTAIAVKDKAEIAQDKTSAETVNKADDKSPAEVTVAKTAKDDDA